MMRNPLVQTTLNHLHLQRRPTHGDDSASDTDCAALPTANADSASEHGSVFGTRTSFERLSDSEQLQQRDITPDMTSRRPEVMA